MKKKRNFIIEALLVVLMAVFVIITIIIAMQMSAILYFENRKVLAFIVGFLCGSVAMIVDTVVIKWVLTKYFKGRQI